MESPPDVTLAQAARAWLRARAAGGAISAHTTVAYTADITAIATRLCQVLGRPADQPLDAILVADLTTAHLREAFAEFSTTHAVSTLARTQATWRGLTTFCAQEDWLPGDPMAGIAKARPPKRHPKPLRGGEDTTRRLLAFLSSPGRAGKDPWRERDLAVIATLLVTGMRSAEARDANRGDVYAQDGDAYLRVTGKGNKTRSIPVMAGLITVLDQYEQSRADRFPTWKPRFEDPLFVDGANTRLTGSQLRHLVTECFRQAGVGAAFPRGARIHSLRHESATQAALHGASAVEIQALLGHESLNTSQGYIQAVGREVRAAAASNPAYRYLDPPR